MIVFRRVFVGLQKSVITTYTGFETFRSFRAEVDLKKKTYKLNKRHYIKDDIWKDSSGQIVRVNDQVTLSVRGRTPVCPTVTRARRARRSTTTPSHTAALAIRSAASCGSFAN
jgi:hypothetical protein